MNKAVRTLSALTVIGFALTGCVASPTTAAVVDGQVTISERSVQQATDAVVAAFDAPVTEARSFAINRLIQGALAERMAASNGITLSDAQREQVIAGQEQLVALVAQPGGVDVAHDWIDISIVAEALGDESLLTEVAKHDVVVNPRYGAWDPAQISTAGSGSLSVPVDAVEG